MDAEEIKFMSSSFGIIFYGYIDMTTFIPLGFIKFEDIIPLCFIKNSLNIPLGFIKK